MFQESAELRVIKLASEQNGSDRPAMHLLEHVSVAGRTSLAYRTACETIIVTPCIGSEPSIQKQ